MLLILLTITLADPAVLTFNPLMPWLGDNSGGNGMPAGTAITLSTTGALPSNLPAGVYYVSLLVCPLAHFNSR